jgi:foldase protein PrsA
VAFAALVAGLATATGAQAQDTRVAVTVASGDGTPPAVIMVDQVRHWTEFVRRANGGAVPVRQLHQQAIQGLTTSAWMEGEAREQGIVVSDAEVRKSFEEQKRQSFPRDADFRRYLKLSGQTQQDIEQRVRIDLIERRIHDRVIAPAAAGVSEQDVTDFIAQHLQQAPERRDVRLIVTRTIGEADAARAVLEVGGTWRAVARRYSSDARTKHRSGVEKWLRRHDLPKPVARAIFKAQPQRLTGPIHTTTGYYVFAVSRIHPAITYALDRETVRETLVSQAQQHLLDAFMSAFTAKWTARTTCAPEYAFAEECANRK